MKRLAILCIAIAIALVIAVVASNKSAYARSSQPFDQELENQPSETQGSETQAARPYRAPNHEQPIKVVAPVRNRCLSKRSFGDT